GCFLMGLLLSFMATVVQAKIATYDETELVCRNWLANIVNNNGDWAGSTTPEIRNVRELKQDDLTLAHCYAISPQGYVVVPVLRELPAIKAYSTECNLDVDETSGFTQLLRDVLSDRFRLYKKFYGDLDIVQPAVGEILLDRKNGRLWERFLTNRKDFNTTLASDTHSPMVIVGPLMTTVWDQGSPYNDYCPMGDGGRCVAGCVATAFSQIMAYHQWPTEGEGNYTYYWSGDNSCDGNVGGSYLTADFSDPYDWDHIIDFCSMGCEPEDSSALAELCYEVGVALEMNYGHCASGAWPYMMVNQLPTHFGYKTGISEVYRSDYNVDQWFDIVVEQIDQGLPMEYTIYSHSIVCDGYSTNDDLKQYHINYGWGGSHNSWFAIDGIYCPWDGCDPLLEAMIIDISPDKTILIDADTTIGWVPLGVAFTGYSELNVDTWTWDFGNGDSAFIQSPFYTYDTAGMFDVALEINAGGDIRNRTKIDYIIALADSLKNNDIETTPGAIVEIVIDARNVLPLNKVIIPIEYSGDLDLTYQSFSTEGCLTDYFELKQQVWFDPSAKTTTFLLQSSSVGTSPDLEPGTGPILKIYFEVSTGASPGQSTTINLDGYSSSLPKFFTYKLDYEVRVAPGVVSYDPCCVGIRGNVNDDPEDEIDIADLVYLANYMFISGPEPACFPEADINGTGAIDISDMIYMISYMFQSGWPPLSCP
ncbi:MAG: C10 family peptidase, partial [candidate division Zixibacteria bacterium]|nr:C10 family peptidase [candidate division Zixibacteria bacterium]